MSKKIAVARTCIGADVKVGHGAFMETLPAAVEVETDGRDRPWAGAQDDRAGRRHEPSRAWLPRNAPEVVEAIETLHGRGPADFRQHCIDVAAEMLLIAGVVVSPEEGRVWAGWTLDDGTAWAKFREWIAAQGGDLRCVDDPTRLPGPPISRPWPVPRSGYVARADAW